MDLFVIRHAIAVSRTEDESEETRPLTPKGRKRFARVARGLESLGVRFNHLLHSPLRRTAQTAEELTGLLDGESAVSAHLTSSPSNALLEEIAAGGESVACVGHDPWVGDLVTLLTSGGTPALTFKKGGVAHLRGLPRAGEMELVAFLPPRVLVRLGERK